MEGKSCQRLSLSDGHTGDFFLCHTFLEVSKVPTKNYTVLKSAGGQQYKTH